MKKLLSFLLLISLLTSVCHAETYLKIGLKYGSSCVTECTLTSDSGFYGFSEGVNIFAADEKTLTVKADESGIINIYSEKDPTLSYYAFPTAEAKVEIAPASGDEIKFNETAYRGSIIISAGEKGIQIVNCVEMESYLKSVVPSEMPSGWNIEALKAQAICARNYALSNLGKYKKYGFDMDDTVSNQVYRGIKSETSSTNQAVEETKGIYLKYDDELVQTFFFSSGAGSTEDVKNVWGSEIPYLKSVEVPGEEVREWEKSFTIDEMNERLKTAGVEIGSVQKIEITKKSETGRVTQVVITGDDGTYTADREKARTIFGLNSAFYDLYVSGNTIEKPDTDKYDGSTLGAVLGKYIAELLKPFQFSADSDFTFKGKGSGHAIGMSQYGAKALADNGYTYDQILTHFYTGSYIEQN